MRTKDDYVFEALEEAAAAGERCPTNLQLAMHLNRNGFERASTGGIPQIVMRLVRIGAIVVRIYGGNYRDVTICKGPHEGQTTAPPAHGGAPYLIVDQLGRRPFTAGPDLPPS